MSLKDGDLRKLIHEELEIYEDSQSVKLTKTKKEHLEEMVVHIIYKDRQGENYAST